MDAITQINWQSIIQIISLILLILCGVLAVILIDQTEKNKDLKAKLNHLERSFNELDAQAKLIVKTDLDLNKAQEELDKRLNGLDALQKVSRLISTTLDESEIFSRLNDPIISELGFEKYLIATTEAQSQPQTRISYGFENDDIQVTMENPLVQNIFSELSEHQLISSVTESSAHITEIAKNFKVKHFIIAPILSQNHVVGLIFAGNQSDAYAFTEGDEELISIFADQLTQALENARLFEEVFRSSQALESKVQERTKQLSQVLEEVQLISKTKSEFISAVSHELRTPLTSIKGYASILITGKIGAVPDQVKERLEKINTHSDNLVKLINDLLDISRIESGRIEMKFTKSSIKSIVENIIDLLTPQIKEKDINIKTGIEPDIPEIKMDVSQVERVFINLISNAIKFTPQNGTIKIGARVNNDEILMSITDTGIGIDEENQAKLFNEFFRVENVINQNVKGTGLGLALVKKIIEAHGGRIWVKSAPQKGASFSFTLPLKSTAEKQDEPTKQG